MEMSFVLPRPARTLRFTGEAKALVSGSEAPNPGANVLGKPRTVKPEAPRAAAPGAMNVRTPVFDVQTRVRMATPKRTSGADLYDFDAAPTAYMPPSARRGRSKLDSLPDDPTVAMDRDGFDVLPGRRVRTPAPMRAPNAPAVPNFRVQPMLPVAIGPSERRSRKAKTKAPYAFWFFASVLVAMLSYRLAPAIMTHFEAPVQHALEP